MEKKLVQVHKVGDFIYFTSDEGIKESDGSWILDTRSNCIAQNLNNHIKAWNPACRKIVATTNPDIRQLHEFNEPDPVYPRKNIKGWGAFPKIHTTFIEEYIKLYNAGTPIEGVELKTEQYSCKGYCDTKGKTNGIGYCDATCVGSLKLSPEGYVIIKPNERLIRFKAKYGNKPKEEKQDIDWEQVFDDAQSMHLLEFINYQTSKHKS